MFQVQFCDELGQEIGNNWLPQLPQPGDIVEFGCQEPEEVPYMVTAYLYTHCPADSQTAYYRVGLEPVKAIEPLPRMPSEKTNGVDVKAARVTTKVGLGTAQAKAAFPQDIDIEDLFNYHAPTSEQDLKYKEIRSAAKEFARVLLQHTPQCADQTAALRKLRECVMTANAAIALEKH